MNLGCPRIPERPFYFHVNPVACCSGTQCKRPSESFHVSVSVHKRATFAILHSIIIDNMYIKTRAQKIQY